MRFEVSEYLGFPWDILTAWHRFIDIHWMFVAAFLPAFLRQIVEELRYSQYTRTEPQTHRSSQVT